MKAFLESSTYIDWNTPNIKSLAERLATGRSGDIEIARACFEFVRDQIRHSWDFQQNPVTIKASDALKFQTGYCYAKSHLLAALLRANGIPAALCYQRLTITDQPPFCIHGLNAIYLEGIGWYRVDARGNKAGVNAEFSPPLERLAFQPMVSGERDIEGRFSVPHPTVVAVLESCASVQLVYERLAETDFTRFDAGDGEAGVKQTPDNNAHGQETIACEK